MNLYKKTLQHKKTLSSLEDLKQYAQQFSKQLEEKNLVLIDGPLGVGKTQLIREVCQCLQVPQDKIHSPSFSLLNQYQSSKGLIAHADLFRLSGKEDLESTGFWDFIDQCSYAFVEWPFKKDSSGSLIIQDWPQNWKLFYLDMELEKEIKTNSLSVARQPKRIISLYHFSA